MRHFLVALTFYDFFNYFLLVRTVPCVLERVGGGLQVEEEERGTGGTGGGDGHVGVCARNDRKGLGGPATLGDAQL